MNLLNVTSIQRGCVYDGPGMRTTVFLKGCTLNCPWCCNPETISSTPEVFVYKERCLKQQNIISSLCKQCDYYHKGGINLQCPMGVFKETSIVYTIEELYHSILQDKTLYDESEGGVTFSGGEPLLQAVSLEPLLKRLNRENINIWLETTLMAKHEYVDCVKKYVNGLYVDLKLQPTVMGGHLTDNRYLEVIRGNLESFVSTNNIQICFRMVFIDGMLSYFKEILNVLLSLNINRLELLKFHSLGHNKYKRLSLEYKNFTPSDDSYLKFYNVLTNNGIKVEMLKI